jgi:hypothetical protein
MSIWRDPNMPSAVIGAAAALIGQGTAISWKRYVDRARCGAKEASRAADMPQANISNQFS